MSETTPTRDEAATPVSEAGGGPTYVANCCNCGRIVDTREAAEGGDDFGSELADGERWVCSPECWDAVVEPALAKPASSPATEVTMPTEVFNAYRAEMGLPPVVKTPTTEGFFWARWLKACPGTADNGEGCDPERWEVVSVFENSLDTQCEEYLMVMVPGVEQSQPLGNFEWGAEVRR